MKKIIFISLFLLSVTSPGCGALANIKIPINVPVKDNKIETEAKADIKAVALDKSNKTETKTVQNAGANATANSGNTNDTDLMKTVITEINKNIGLVIGVISTIFGGFVSLILSIFGLFKWQGNMYKKLLDAKDLFIENLSKSNTEKDTKLDKWFQDRLEKVLNGGQNGKTNDND